MTTAQFARIFFIIIKIFFGQHPVLIPNEPVRLHLGRIEFDLQFNIFGNRKQCATEFIHQYFLRLSNAIDIGMITVSFIGQLLHLGILIVAHAISQHRQEHPAFSFLFNQGFHILVTAGANIKVTISTKDHPVISVLNKVITGGFIRKFYTGTTSSGTTGFQLFNRFQDGFLFFP